MPTLAATSDAEQQPEQRADRADHEPLREEDRDDAAGRQPEGAQDRDVRALFVHDHHQRRDDVEGGHGDDEQQDQAHHRLLDADRAEISGVFFAPVRDREALPRRGPQLADARGGAHHVVEPHPQPGGYRIGRTGQVRGIGQRHQREGAVVVLQADFEHSGHGEGLQHGLAAGREHVASRHHHGQLVADLGPDLPGQDAAEDQGARTGLEVGERALDQVLFDRGNRAFGLRVDAVQQDGFQRPGTPQHRLHVDERRDPLHPRHGLEPLGKRGPLREPARGSGDRGVGGQGNEPVAQFTLEAVHDRDDGDERSDAQADAGHRDPGDEGDEKALAAGPDVAQADEDGQRVKHRGEVTGGETSRKATGRARGLHLSRRARCGQRVNWNKDLAGEALADSRPVL